MQLKVETSNETHLFRRNIYRTEEKPATGDRDAFQTFYFQIVH